MALAIPQPSFHVSRWSAMWPCPLAPWLPLYPPEWRIPDIADLWQSRLDLCGCRALGNALLHLREDVLPHSPWHCSWSQDTRQGRSQGGTDLTITSHPEKRTHCQHFWDNTIQSWNQPDNTSFRVNSGFILIHSGSACDVIDIICIDEIKWLWWKITVLSHTF